MPKNPLDEMLTHTAALAPRITEQELRRAVDRGQLCAHYQPKVIATPGGWEVVAIESLLRWQHPEHGLILPGHFIALAETHGLIGALTDYVLQTGIDQLGEWNRSGLRLGLCVNLSPTLVTDLEFPDRLGHPRVPPRRPGTAHARDDRDRRAPGSRLHARHPLAPAPEADRTLAR
jgi:sensor c-di-GMP phosphodiesterase-like protein